MKSLLEYVKSQAKLSGRQLLSYDTLAEFPKEQAKELEVKGVLFQIRDADGIICTECDQECWKPVETRIKDGKAIGVIYCEDEDCGSLIPVELVRLQQWEITDKIKPYLPKIKKTPDNPPSIKKGNSSWVFSFNNNTATVTFKGKQLQGLALIECLLMHPDKDYSPLDLMKDVGQRDRSETEPEKMLSEADIAKTKKAITGLREWAKQAIELEKQTSWERKADEAEASLHKMRNCRGKSRKISEKNRIAVIRNIDTVLKKISPQSGVIYNHFNSFLIRGEICCYKPDSDIVWDIS